MTANTRRRQYEKRVKSSQHHGNVFLTGLDKYGFSGFFSTVAKVFRSDRVSVQQFTQRINQTTSFNARQAEVQMCLWSFSDFLSRTNLRHLRIRVNE